jgi:hypothetical protein
MLIFSIISFVNLEALKVSCHWNVGHAILPVWFSSLVSQENREIFIFKEGYLFHAQKNLWDLCLSDILGFSSLW